MRKIMFVCLGNICRSPMAEFLMKRLLKQKGVEGEFCVQSSATSYEEQGNPVHYGTARILDKYQIDYSQKRARRLEKSDYDKFDYFIGMEKSNVRGMLNIFDDDKDDKISLIMDYTDHPKDVADPWYTGNFDATEKDVLEGINGLYEFLTKQKSI